MVAWTALLLVVLFWLSGPLLFGPLIVLAFPELWGGNITILLAAAVVAGFRFAGHLGAAGADQGDARAWACSGSRSAASGGRWRSPA